MAEMEETNPRVKALKEENKSLNEKAQLFSRNEQERKLFFENEKDEDKLLQMAIRIGDLNFLLSQLISGDNKTVMKILSHKRICSKLFQDPTSPFLNVDYLFDDFFPNASYFLRMKIINKIRVYMKDESKGDEIYNKLKDIYGKTTADLILPICSQNFMKEMCFKSNKRFDSNVIQNFLRKFPILFEDEEFMKCLKDTHGYIYSISSFVNSTPIHKISEKILQKSFTECYADQNRYIFFSRKKTKLFLTNFKEQIIQNPSKFRQYLHKPKTLNLLTRKEFISFIQDTFQCDDSAEPKIRPKFTEALQWIKIDRKWKDDEVKKMLISAMNQHWTYLEPNHSDFFKFFMLLDVETRLKLIEKNTGEKKKHNIYVYDYGKYFDDQTWEACKPCSITLPKYKNLISKEREVIDRANLVDLLVFSCNVNNDPTSFQDVIEYVNAKFRNDRITIREKFYAACNQFFKKSEIVTFKNLEGILETVKLSKALNEFKTESYRTFEEHILRMYMEKLPTEIPESILLQYFKLIENSYFSFDNDKQKEQQKNYLPQFVDYMEEIYEKDKNHFDDSFFTTVVDRIKQFLPNEMSRIFEKHPLFKSKVEGMMNDIKNNESDSLWNLLKPHPKKAVDDRMIQFFPSEYNVDDAIQYFLKTNPNVILENIQIVLKNYFDQEDNSIHSRGRYRRSSYSKKRIAMIFGKILKSGNEEIKQEIVKFCTKIIEDEKSENIQFEKAMQVISIYDEEMFITIATKYLPTESKISIEEESRHLTQLQMNSAKYLKNISLSKNFNDLMPLIKGFSIGEYFKFTEGAIIRIVSSMDPKVRDEFLLKMMESFQISQKKLVIRLIYLMSSRNQIMPFLTKTFKIGKNYSIFEVISNKLFILLTEEPTEEKWNYFEEVIEGLMVENLILLNGYQGSIPNQFISKFSIISVQKYLKEINKAVEDEKKAILKNYESFLEGLQNYVEKFAENFMNFIINERKIVFHQFKQEKTFYKIMSKYLVGKQRNEAEIDRIIEIFKVEKQEVKEFTSQFNLFIREIFMFLLREIIFDTKGQENFHQYFQYCKKLTNFFTNDFEETQNFNIYLTLKLTNELFNVVNKFNGEEMKTKTKDSNFWGTKISEITCDILHETFSKYGDKINVVVVSILTQDLKSIFSIGTGKKFLISFGKNLMTPKYPELKPELLQIFKSFSFNKKLRKQILDSYLDTPLLQIYNQFLFPGSSDYRNCVDSQSDSESDNE